MPVADKIKVTIDGEVREVGIADVDGVFTGDQFQKRFASELNRRTKALTSEALEKALQDDDFRAKALAAWGIDDEQSSAQDQVSRLREAWERENVTPLQKQLTEQTAERDGLRLDARDATILHAALAVGVRRRFLQPAADGLAPPIVSMTAAAFGYDPELRGWYVKDGDSFAYSSKTGRPKTADEFFETWAADKANAGFLDDKRRRR